MTSSNKIIPFKQETHHRAKSEFRLKTQISIYIRKEAEKFTVDCTSSNEDDTIEGILLILKKVLAKISTQIPEIEIKKIEYYEVSFTLLYYEDINNKHNWKYISIPKDIKLEKIAEYLYVFISVYEYKKTQH